VGLGLLIVVAACAYLYHAFAHLSWGWSFMGFVLSSAFGFGFWHAIVSEHVSTNHGEFYREKRPGAFWITVSLCFGLYVAAIATLLLPDHWRKSSRQNEQQVISQ